MAYRPAYNYNYQVESIDRTPPVSYSALYLQFTILQNFSTGRTPLGFRGGQTLNLDSIQYLRKKATGAWHAKFMHI